MLLSATSQNLAVGARDNFDVKLSTVQKVKHFLVAIFGSFLGLVAFLLIKIVLSWN